MQTHDWNCGNLVTPNEKRKPFDDVRVRRALLLAVDQWHGAPALSKIANVHTVGGIVFPGSPLAATKEELEKLAGFWPDIEKSRAEARRLLKEAGQEGLRIDLLNRNVDQPYKYVGTWLVDQWSKIGVTATQRVLPTGPWLQAMRTGDFDVVVEANCNSVVNPVLDTQKYLPREKFAGNYGGYSDPEEVEIYEKMLRETDFDQAAGADATVRDAHDRNRGARVSDAVVVPHDPRAVLCAWVEDRPQPLHQPGSVQYLAGRGPLATGAARRVGCRTEAMYQYVAKRVLLVIPTLFGAAALVFVLMRLIPGDICVVRLGSGGGISIHAPSPLCHAENRPRPAADHPVPRLRLGVLPLRLRHLDVVRQAGVAGDPHAAADLARDRTARHGDCHTRSRSRSARSRR